MLKPLACPELLGVCAAGTPGPGLGGLAHLTVLHVGEVQHLGLIRVSFSPTPLEEEVSQSETEPIWPKVTRLSAGEVTELEDFQDWPVDAGRQAVWGVQWFSLLSFGLV